MERLQLGVPMSGLAAPNDLQHNQQPTGENTMTIEEANIAQVQANTEAVKADTELKKAHARLLNAQADELLRNAASKSTTV